MITYVQYDLLMHQLVEIQSLDVFTKIIEELIDHDLLSTGRIEFVK